MADQESAIREDVQDSESEETTEQRDVNPRQELIERITQMNRESIARSNEEYGSAHGTIPTPEEREAQPEPAQTVKVKIDGEEMELPISEVVKGYQKDQTASRRLEEAAMRMREADERERLLQERLRQITEANETAEHPPAVDDEPRIKARKIIESIIEGDTDNAADSLIEVLGATSRQQTEAPRLSDQIKQEIRQIEFEREFAQAQAMFHEEHADLNNNPRLASMVNDVYFQQIEAGKMPIEAASVAVREVRQFVSELTGSKPPQQTVNRQERKQSYDTITPAAGRTEGNKTEESTPQSIIAEMRRQRGQV